MVWVWIDGLTPFLFLDRLKQNICAAMHSFKKRIIYGAGFAVFVAGWSMLARTQLFFPLPTVLSAQDESPELVGYEGAQQYVLVTQVRAISESDVGVFLYANNEARFYPFRILAISGPQHDSISGVAYTVSGADADHLSVQFPGGQALPYEVSTFADVKYQFPETEVFVGP